MTLFNRNNNDKTSDKYLANMSHELRTPMNAIVGLAELLMQQTNNPSQQETITALLTATRNLEMTVNNIIDFESLQRGSIKATSEEVNLEKLLEEVASIALLNLNSTNIRFVMSLDPSIPKFINSDGKRIQQLLSHLLFNSVKHTKSGFVKLSVNRVVNRKSASLEFIVEDTGTGMSPQEVEKANANHKNKMYRVVREGVVGIGLSISKELAKVLGGTFEISSSIGEITRARFTLPIDIDNYGDNKVIDADKYRVAIFIKDVAARENLSLLLKRLGVDCFELEDMGQIFLEHEKGPFTHIFIDYEKCRQFQEFKKISNLDITCVAVADNLKAVNDSLTDKYLDTPVWYKKVIALFNGVTEETDSKVINAESVRILLVDDNDINLKVTGERLKKVGFAVDTADSGDVAVKAVVKNQYDVVLMDYMMPEMDGIEATQIIRGMEDEYFRTIPIIALTANIVDGVRDKLLEAGMNDYLPKPIMLKDLIECLKKWVPEDKMMNARLEDENAQADKTLCFDNIDVETGLGYSGNDIKIYLEALRSYANSIDEKGKLLGELARTGDVGRFTIEVHGLKSSSKMIGANALADVALELERLGHKRDTDAILLGIEHLESLIGKVSEELRPFMSEKEMYSGGTAFDREEICNLLKALIAESEEFDYDAMEQTIFKVGSFELPQSIRPLYGELVKACDNIDYDGTKRVSVALLECVEKG